jgi:hypothetical protein
VGGGEVVISSYVGWVGGGRGVSFAARIDNTSPANLVSSEHNCIQLKSSAVQAGFVLIVVTNI